MPKSFLINDNMIELPADEKEAEDIDVYYGPNIKPFPKAFIITNNLSATAVLKVGDNITTDHIMPAGAKILPFRSNIPYLSKFCFAQNDPNFAENCKKAGSSIVIGGENYGQGSSREHAALVPLYLGVKAVIVKSFARIHKANLINAGIIPLIFINTSDYEGIDEGDSIVFPNIKDEIAQGLPVTLINNTKQKSISLKADFSQRQKDILLGGGLLEYTKGQSEND